jgi:hypothetical protein
MIKWGFSIERSIVVHYDIGRSHNQYINYVAWNESSFAHPNINRHSNKRKSMDSADMTPFISSQSMSHFQYFWMKDCPINNNYKALGSHSYFQDNRCDSFKGFISFVLG